MRVCDMLVPAIQLSSLLFVRVRSCENGGPRRPDLSPRSAVLRHARGRCMYCRSIYRQTQAGVAILYYFTQLKQSQCMPTKNKSASHSHANTASQPVYQANNASHSVFHVNKARLTAAMPTKQCQQCQQSRANRTGQPTSHSGASS
jgi:hypothetical protein